MTYAHLMYDIETLSKRANAVVVSIGGCFFDLESDIGPSFEIVLDIQAQLDRGRVVDASTIKFWLTETDDEAKKVFDREGDSLSLVKHKLEARIVQNTEGMNSYYAWAKGKEFDLAIIKDLWVVTMGSTEPWYYNKAECYRTLVNRIPKEVLNKIEKKWGEEERVLHNAEQDARYQAHIALDCLRWLNEKIGEN